MGAAGTGSGVLPSSLHRLASAPASSSKRTHCTFPDPAAHDKAFEANFEELEQWVDTTERDYVLLHVRRERRKQRYGNALRLLNKQIGESEPNYWYHKKRRDIYEALGWDHLHQNESQWLLLRFPNAYEPL